MSAKFPRLTAFLLILVLAVPMFLAPSATAPTASAAKAGDITSANDAVASKVHPKLQAAVAAAALSDAFDVIVYAEAGADLRPYMSNMLAAKYVLPNGTQTYYGRVKAANVAKLASLPAVAAIEDLRFQGSPAAARARPEAAECLRPCHRPCDHRGPEGEEGQRPVEGASRRARPGGRLVRRARRAQVEGGVGPGVHGPRRQGPRQRHGN